MIFEVDGPRLRTPEGAMIEFKYPIQEVAAVGDVIVVLLDVPPKESMTENIFGVSNSGKILWQIERIAATATYPVNCYTSILTTLKLYNWNGNGVEIDATTGKVIQT